MTTQAVERAPEAARLPRLPLFLRLALRELRSGLSGFRVFVACIALGVAAIAGVGSLAGALESGLERQGREILGGDLSLELVHRRAEAEQQAVLAGYGAISEMASLRAMARPSAGGRPALVQIKAVDGAYPLFGETILSAPEGDVQIASLRQPGTAAAERLLLSRLGLRVGDSVRVGNADLRIVATVESEPDKLAGRMEFGPRLMMSLATLDSTGLVQPGSLIRWHYRLRLDGAADATTVAEVRAAIEARFPEAGFMIRDRSDPSPNVSRAIDRFSQFMTLIGVAVLMIGGVGVANAIATYLARKREVIAAFKCLGASSRTIVATYLAQVLLLAAVGIVAGVALGALLPPAVAAAYGEELPIRLALEVQPAALAMASLYGVLTALLFVLWPLGQARDLPPALLLRQPVTGEAAWPRPLYLLLSGLCGLMLLALAVLSSERMLLSLYVCLGLVAAFVLFLGLAAAIRRAARAVPRRRRPELSLALAGLAAPGSLVRPVTLSLGASLTLLAGVALINASLVAELETNIPAEAPSYFLIDVPAGAADDVRTIVRRHVPQASISTAPMLRGRIVSLNGAAADESKAAPEVRWVLNGDRGLTFADTVPEASRLVAGDWWPADYDGPPLVSFEDEIAKGLGLAIGDTVTVNVLGRNIEARIANLRSVDWESLAINFVMVFSPNALAGAPFNVLATLGLPQDLDEAEEAGMVQALAEAFPSVTAVRVREALDTFKALLERVMVAIRAASGLTLVTGALVLAGALGTSHRRRIRDAVIFKTLGASRRRILIAHMLEYAGLAVVTGAAALGVATLASFLIVRYAMDATFVFSPAAVAQALGLAVALVLAFGAVGTWRTLSVRPAQYLRAG